MSKRVLQLVDSREYAVSNCFQHQLLKTLHRSGHQVVSFTLEEILGQRLEGEVDSIISCLKMRTLYRNLTAVRGYVGDREVTVYDQDPWEGFRDDGQFKGSYDAVHTGLNVRTFAVTSKWWSDLVSSRGMPSTFVPMWVLPEYCDNRPPWVERQTPVGFLGTVHGRRFKLFEHLRQNGVNVAVHSGGPLPYGKFLAALSGIQVFVHSEDAPMTVDGEPCNMGTGLWVKDIEAAARGCYSIRNRLEGHETYLEGIDTVKLYDSPDEVPGIIRTIQMMDPVKRQEEIDLSVERIRCSDRWSETVATLVGE